MGMLLNKKRKQQQKAAADKKKALEVKSEEAVQPPVAQPEAAPVIDEEHEISAEDPTEDVEPDLNLEKETLSELEDQGSIETGKKKKAKK